MSKHSVNQDRFKVAGREPQPGHDVLQEANRKMMAEERAKEKRESAPPVPTEAPPEERPSVEEAEKKADKEDERARQANEPE